KDILVKFLLMKRGRYNRPFMHIATMGVLAVGILVGPMLADTYPIFSSNASAVSRIASSSSQQESIALDTNVFKTDVSQKPRDQIISYTVERGDTLSTIAEKFGISADTIKWENNLTDDNLSVGDDLKILPVTGIAYKVQSGDTVYSIAKKFATDAQKIVDFPFNDFANPETFSLVAGEILIVPDGVQPTSQRTYIAPVYVQVPEYSGERSGGFIWPIRGIITQYFTWYHTGLDIAGPVGTPIYAAKAGIADEASCGWNYGYGCHVLLDNGGGYQTMYAHMVTQPVIGAGQSVTQGQLIGYRGSTGRSTGPHTHFEIRFNGHVVNPLPYLP
ncbi:MAG: M23 family metallopeptidase, partial [Patescibacteria group bacterium]|nr:M23 family metallopeptidase [Patescibacteria group bacterium]